MAIVHGAPFPYDTTDTAGIGQFCWLSREILLLYADAGEGEVGDDLLLLPSGFGTPEGRNYHHARAWRVDGLEVVEAGPIFATNIAWKEMCSVCRIDSTHALITYVDYVNVPKNWPSTTDNPPPAGYVNRSSPVGDGVARVLTVDPDTLEITRGPLTVFSAATYDDAAHGTHDGSAGGLGGAEGLSVTAMNSQTAVVGYNYGHSPDNRNFFTQIAGGTFEILENCYDSYRLCVLSVSGTDVTAGPETVVESGETDLQLRRLVSRGGGAKPYSFPRGGFGAQEPIRTSGSGGVFVYSRGAGYQDGCAIPFTVSGTNISLGSRTIFAPTTIKAEFVGGTSITVSFNNGMSRHYNTAYGNKVAVLYPWVQGWNNGVADASEMITILDNGGEVIETFAGALPTLGDELQKIVGVGDLFATMGNGNESGHIDTIRMFNGASVEDTVTSTELNESVDAAEQPVVGWASEVDLSGPDQILPASQVLFGGTLGVMSLFVEWVPSSGEFGSGSELEQWGVIFQGSGGILTLGLRNVRINAITDIDGRGQQRATMHSNALPPVGPAT